MIDFEMTIHFRYAQTTIEAHMRNPSAKSREMTFSVILPDSAFVSNFSMILRNNQEFVARVMEKEKATEAYKGALQNNGAAGLVQTNTRNANQVHTLPTIFKAMLPKTRLFENRKLV